MLAGLIARPEGYTRLVQLFLASAWAELERASWRRAVELGGWLERGCDSVRRGRRRTAAGASAEGVGTKGSAATRNLQGHMGARWHVGRLGLVGGEAEYMQQTSVVALSEVRGAAISPRDVTHLVLMPLCCAVLSCLPGSPPGPLNRPAADAVAPLLRQTEPELLVGVAREVLLFAAERLDLWKAHYTAPADLLGAWHAWWRRGLCVAWPEQ